MVEPRFKEGDKITYKSTKDCGGSYNFSGDNQGGFVGTVRRYYDYYEKHNCHSLSVTTPTGSYQMLESEFIEYDSTPKDPAYDIY